MPMSKQAIARILDRFALFLFVSTLAVLVFGYGVAVGTYRIFPYDWLVAAKHAVDPTAESGDVSEGRSNRILPSSELHHLYPAWHDFSGARTHNADAIMPGVTLLTGYWKTLDWKPGVRLIDSDGNVLHEWKTDPAEIWPTSPHRDHIAGSKNVSLNYVH